MTPREITGYQAKSNTNPNAMIYFRFTDWYNERKFEYLEDAQKELGENNFLLAGFIYDGYQNIVEPIDDLEITSSTTEKDMSDFAEKIIKEYCE